jgi:hypothetical protein
MATERVELLNKALAIFLRALIAAITKLTKEDKDREVVAWGARIKTMLGYFICKELNQPETEVQPADQILQHIADEVETVATRALQTSNP